MIRPATYADIPRIVALGHLLHDESSYRTLSFDPVKVSDFLASLIAGAGVVFVAERNNEVIGGMAGGCGEHWFTQDLVAFDYSVFIEPGKRHGITASKLIRAFVEWAKLRGAKQVNVGITTNINVEATSRLYKYNGFQDGGVLFRMELNDGN